ncbi:hypothetical protein B0A50_08385 [Salinomyces thailandicus]|uniref:BZIP domain-containing protein n=1 Tax=Salinomyces thailandicus TaxID=706561 RepID=A0A4U0TLX1_9PEZI|nr:hypothetical protein B0A50_08385 [Salinomyces thailandica]
MGATELLSLDDFDSTDPAPSPPADPPAYGHVDTTATTAPFNICDTPAITTPAFQHLDPSLFPSITSPTHPSSTSSARKSSTRSPDEVPNRDRKRQRNTAAARRYRQRKTDRVAELEDALAAVSKERDDLKLRLARSEAETGILKELVGRS